MQPGRFPSFLYVHTLVLSSLKLAILSAASIAHTATEVSCSRRFPRSKCARSLFIQLESTEKLMCFKSKYWQVHRRRISLINTACLCKCRPCYAMFAHSPEQLPYAHCSTPTSAENGGVTFKSCILITSKRVVVSVVFVMKEIREV
jgi:hypothetical protein